MPLPAFPLSSGTATTSRSSKPRNSAAVGCSFLLDLWEESLWREVPAPVLASEHPSLVSVRLRRGVGQTDHSALLNCSLARPPGSAQVCDLCPLSLPSVMSAPLPRLHGKGRAPTAPASSLVRILAAAAAGLLLPSRPRVLARGQRVRHSHTLLRSFLSSPLPLPLPGACPFASPEDLAPSSSHPSGLCHPEALRQENGNWFPLRHGLPCGCFSEGVHCMFTAREVCPALQESGLLGRASAPNPATLRC